MKKILKISVLLATALNASILVNPLGNNVKSIDNGGSLNAIDAYKDGIGVIVLDNLGLNTQVDNSAMNKLVYKYGEAAKVSEVSIVDQVMTTGTVEDKAVANGLKVDGLLCNDGNSLTFNETWLNGICQGGVVNGTACSDENAATVGEKYLNGVCQGGIIGNIASNGLIYDNCEGGQKLYSNATIYCASKGMRIPTIWETKPGGGIIESCSLATGTWALNAGTNMVQWHGMLSSSGNYNSNIFEIRCVK